MNSRLVVLVALAGCTGPKTAGDGDDTGVIAEPVALPEDCSALPAQVGLRIGPEDAATFRQTLASAAPGTVYLLDDGTYALTGGDGLSNLAVPAGVTLRGASGDPARVVLEGGYATGELVTLGAGATLADVTVSHSYADAVAVHGESGARVYRVHVVDPGGRGVAVLPERGAYADGAVLGCVTVSRTETCAVGVEVIQSDASHIYGTNVDQGACDNAAMAVHSGSRDTVIERVQVTTAGVVALRFGDRDYVENEERVYADTPCPDGFEIGHYGGVLRNVSALGGIRVESACGARVAHVSVWGGDLGWSFVEELAVQNAFATLADAGGATTEGVLTPVAADFVNAAEGDLHLVAGSAAVDAGVDAGVVDDLDGDPRVDGAPDIGADER